MFYVSPFGIVGEALGKNVREVCSEDPHRFAHNTFVVDPYGQAFYHEQTETKTQARPRAKETEQSRTYAQPTPKAKPSSEKQAAPQQAQSSSFQAKTEEPQAWQFNSYEKKFPSDPDYRGKDLNSDGSINPNVMADGSSIYVRREFNNNDFYKDRRDEDAHTPPYEHKPEKKGLIWGNSIYDHNMMRIGSIDGWGVVRDFFGAPIADCSILTGFKYEKRFPF